jgi:hypothetical protein
MGTSLTGATVVCLLTASSAFADVRLQLQDGRVSIVAKDATVRQILTEWARVGQTKIVNVERIPGGPVTLELSNVPEAQALDVLLRSVSGYMAAPRGTAVANLSVFDRIIVMPTVAAPRPAASSAPTAPTFQQPQFTPAAQPPDDDGDDAPAARVQMPNPPRGPVFNAFPPPQVGGAGASGVPVMPVAPGAPAQPTPVYGSTPSAPANGGVAVPGMVAPTPVQPGLSPSVQPPPPQPGQIIRPGGRGGGAGGQ